MTVPVDRPRPVDWHGPNGEVAKIIFSWGYPDDPVPKGFRVHVRTIDGREQVLHEKAIYQTYEEARDRGVKLALSTMRSMEQPPIP